LLHDELFTLTNPPAVRAVLHRRGFDTPGPKDGAQAPDLTNGSPQELSGLGHQELTTVEGMEDFQALLGAVRHDDHASPSSVQPREDIFADPLGRT
jgi:hypothetical protein